MNIWNAPNVAYRLKAHRTAGAVLRIFQSDMDREHVQSIERPSNRRTVGDAVHAYVGYGMATEVLADTMHRTFNAADIRA